MNDFQVYLQSVLDGLFPSDPELRLQMYEKARPRIRQELRTYPSLADPLMAAVSVNNESGVTVKVYHGGSSSFCLNFKQPEQCCAQLFLHEFHIFPLFDEKQMTTFLDAIFKSKHLREHFSCWSNQRLIINMVERNRNKVNPLEIIEPIEKPSIMYRELWDYFHKHAVRVNTMFQPNKNTGNIIHHMEVLFESSDDDVDDNYNEGDF